MPPPYPTRALSLSPTATSRQSGTDTVSLLAEADGDALVVVDQNNNIGSLVVRRCRAAGTGVGHVTGLTTRKARDMWPGTAKTDRIDAEVIARTAMGMRQVVRGKAPYAEPDAACSKPDDQGEGMSQRYSKSAS